MAKDTDRAPLPPYVSWKTFINLIERLKGTSVPNRIDSSVLRTYANSVGRQIIAALKYLRLIEEGGKVTERFRQLVAAYDTSEWQSLFTDVLFEAYAPVHAPIEDLDQATLRELQNGFRAVGADGAVLDKCVSFWVSAMSSAGTNVSSHILNRPKGRPPQRTGKPRTRKILRPAEEESHDSAATITTGTVKFAFPIPGKQSATIFVPAELTAEDWEMVDAMIRAYVERRGKG